MTSVTPEMWKNANRKWHRTPNDQLIDLDRFEEFWIEHIETTNYYKVFGKDISEIEWNLMKTGSKEAAHSYLDELELILKQ
jgi:hypothetical protein